MSRRLLLLPAITMATLVTNLPASSIRADDFRIESEVRMNGDESPISRNLTLFHDGTAYDFRYDPAAGDQLVEVVVFRADSGAFVLLDPLRQAKLGINTSTVADLVARLKTNPSLIERAPHFLEPIFDERWNEQESSLTLTSERIIYRVVGTRTADAEALDAYHVFANWSARLNAADPRKMPPFARLALNSAAHRRGLLPERVDLTIRQSGGVFERNIEVSSTHSAVWRLSKDDRDLIDQALRMLADFTPATRAEYFRLDELADQRP